jgi:hypothetical protein
MFIKKVVVAMDKEKLIVKNLKKLSFKRQVKDTEYSLLSDEKKVNLKGRKNYLLIIQREEVSFGIFDFPKCTKENLESLIYKEIMYKNNSENFIFSYKILKTDKNIIKSAVFYLPFNDEKLEKYIDPGLIGGMFLIQLCVISYLKNKITGDSYILVFSYKGTLYCIFCKDNMIVDNSILDNSCNQSECIEFIENYIKKIVIYNGFSISTVYSFNLQPLEIACFNTMDYYYEDLGEIDEYKFIKYVSRHGSRCYG